MLARSAGRPNPNAAGSTLYQRSIALRHEADASERALFTARRKMAYEALHPETRNGGDRRSESSRQVGELKNADRFTADTAARTGRSERDVQRDATRGERIDETVLAPPNPSPPR